MKRSRIKGAAGRGAMALFALQWVWVGVAQAQTGVDDDRVNLPEGPGSLEGVGENADVNPNMGMMSHSIPIATPNGFDGLSPGLSLSYSSGAGTGLVGLGWSLSTPSIERMVSKGVPRYTADDLFAADGNAELVPVGDGDYRERQERGFVRYHFFEAGAQGYWRAEYPDGRVGWFGADGDGAIVGSARAGDPAQGTARYHLVDLVDAFGNRLHYEYDTFGGNVPLPASVEYGHVGNAGGAAKYVVRFAYEERPDHIGDAGAGYEEVWRVRLANTKVFVSGELVREYTLDYEDEALSGGASRLRTVRTFGVGGAAGGQRLPGQFSFDYSRALGADCAGGADCSRPFVVDMGVLQGAVDLAAGQATLFDINGDGLPDVLDTSSDGPHRFFLNTLTADGAGFRHGFGAPLESRVGDGSTFRLSARNVQEIDLDGDGHADLLNTVTGAFLRGGGVGTDWAGTGAGVDVGVLPSFGGDAFQEMRFLDADNDKRIDLMQANAGQTRVFFNDGERFTARDVEPIGLGFASGNLQLADINGDGLTDPVEIQDGGGVRYRVHLGRGRFTAWRNIPGVSIDPADQPFVDLEDLNGDGLADLVIVTPERIRYAINRNAAQFDALRTIEAADVQGELPQRADGVTVLYADMNANGSEDVVWFDPNGRVRYLELFPVRPHLLTHISNNLGMEQRIVYSTSVEQAARAAAAGRPWDVSLPNAMLVVDHTDTWVSLTGSPDGQGVHEINTYTYRNGYYDGVEKQFRGFTDVDIELAGDESQEAGLTRLVFDNGLVDGYRTGLLLSRSVLSGGRPISETTVEYDDCPVAEVPAPEALAAQGLPAVRFVCEHAEQVVHQEGAEPADWVTTREEWTRDGYGNVSLHADLGVVARGGMACGAACEGDEAYVEASFVAPEAAWILGLPVQRSRFGAIDDPQRTDERFYYDGEDFVGLPAGRATRGFLSRRTERISADADDVVEDRLRATPRGEVAERIDPLGAPGDETTHRRLYSHDDAGLLVTGVTLRLTDPEDAPYELRRTFRYDDRFQSMSESTGWVLYRDGQAASSVNTTRYRYDAQGHLSEQREMGDAEDAPSLRMAYEFGDPVTRLAIRRRLDAQGGEGRSFTCFDGRGRNVQARTQIGAAAYQVSGFNVYNRRGQVVRAYQPWVSDSDACDEAEPEGVRFTAFRYDATGRLLETIEPDAELYGSASVRRIEYAPMATISHDAEDTDAAGPHHGTPTTEYEDGLGRAIALERMLGGDSSRWTFEYNGTGDLVAVTDPAGQVHGQRFDLLGRAIEVDSPHHGIVLFEYDAADNLIARTDGRGATERRTFDGANRLAARFDDASPDTSATTWRYDAAPACDRAECTNTAGEVASVSYPVGVAGIEAGEDRFGYDTKGRLVFTARRLGDVDLPVRLTFDDDDRLTGQLNPDGHEFTRRYDAAGRLTALPGLFSDITWDERGGLAGLEAVNGVAETRTYDALGRLAGLVVTDAAGAPVLSMAFEHDREHNVTAVADAAPGGRRALDVAYDDWYRTTQLTYGDGETVDFAFGSLDQVLSRVSSRGAESRAHVGELAYDAEHATRATTAGAIDYAYDDAGRIARRGEQSLTWDHRGRLVGASGGQGTLAAAYGPDEGPVAVLDDGSLTLYGPEDFEVRDGVAVGYVRIDEARVARHASADFGPRVYPDLAPVDDDGAPAPDGRISAADAWVAWARGEGVLEGGPADVDVALLLSAGARRLLAENEDTTAWLHADQLGSLVAATDAGGEVRGQRDFHTYGAERWSEGYVDAHGYTGEEAFVSTSLLHFRHRELDGFSGRWASADPAFTVLEEDMLGEPSDAFSGYAYAGNDATSRVDPTGLKAKYKTLKNGTTVRVKGNKVKFVETLKPGKKSEMLEGKHKGSRDERGQLTKAERKTARKAHAKDLKERRLLRDPIRPNVGAKAKIIEGTHDRETARKYARRARGKSGAAVAAISGVFAAIIGTSIYAFVSSPKDDPPPTPVPSGSPNVPATPTPNPSPSGSTSSGEGQ